MVQRVCVSRRHKDGVRGAAGLATVGATAGPVSQPLFEGTIYLADVEFAGAGGPWAVAPSDLSVVEQYLAAIAPVITSYASQYGPGRVSAGRRLPRFRAPVTNAQYSDADLQRWIGSMAQANGLSAASAILVLNPPGVTNRDARESGGVGVLGYHGLAALPYCFVNLLGSGFSVDDPADLFAEAVSHETAEMTVDPRADDSNPEVCDGCGTNCLGAQAWRDFFDASGRYLSSDTTFPPSFPYGFFISAMARPSSATDCPAPAAACAYPPP